MKWPGTSPIVKEEIEPDLKRDAYLLQEDVKWLDSTFTGLETQMLANIKLL